MHYYHFAHNSIRTHTCIFSVTLVQILVRQLATMQLVSVLTILLTITNIQCQLWSTPQDFLNNFNWFRQARSKTPTALPNTETTTPKITTIDLTTRFYPTMTTILNQNDPTITTLYSKMMQKLTDPTTTYVTDRIVTTTDSEDVTLDFQDNARIAQHIHTKFEKVQTKTPANISQNLLPLPAGAENVLVKPTKYHYYPHNQHIYLLPECAIQQVCNAVYVRLNWTQPLCACPNRYRDPCSASLNSDDLHTTELITDPSAKRALTLVKTCEPTAEMRLCRTPRDWSLLALQNIRTGKSHYLVICRCPETNILEGPMSHDQPAYASVPGIRVYGMLCSTTRRRGRPLRTKKSFSDLPPFPWEKVKELVKTTSWD